MRRRRIPAPPKAVAIAAAGATAAGGKLAWDRLRARAAKVPSRAYRLEPDEFVPDGVRRIVRGQLDAALEDLAGAADGSLSETVHETRKRLKRLRASLALAREGIPKETYRSEKTAFRDSGRRLAGARDARVLIDTLDSLNERFQEELHPGTSAELRATIAREQEAAVAALNGQDTLSHVTRELASARDRTATLNLESGDFAVLSHGLKRIYRRGRQRMRAAKAEPTAEALHEWRKRVKELWYASQIVAAAAPERMDEFSKRAHRLSELLGEDHDLAVLRAYVKSHSGCFADESPRRALEAVIDRRRECLQREAFELGPKVYRRRPRRFAGSIERSWRKAR